MNITKQQILRTADWVLPPRLFRLLTHYRPSAALFAITHRQLLKKNRTLHQRHAGERCFIMGNGPSLNAQNIKPLKQETVFTVSNGYLHPDYVEIAARYHCVPQVTYSDRFTPNLTAEWFAQMDKNLGNAEIFLAHQEHNLVRTRGLFTNRQIHYICLGRHYFPDTHHPKIDLSGMLPRPQSVPIMALMLALSMGFKEIYLIGVDHDWFVKKEYHYAFDVPFIKGKAGGVDEMNRVTSTLLDDLPMIEKLWSQYRQIRRLAERRGVRIYNATHGGMLDEFERVRLEDVLI